jgi:hypothetical protein
LGSAEIISGVVENFYVGKTTIASPILFLEVDGVPVASSYVVQSVGNSVRFIFPKIVNGNIYIMSMGQVYGNDLPAITLSIKVYAAE